MNTATKLLQSMRNNPRDWRIEQLQTVARQFGMAVYVCQFVVLVDKVKESQA
ncbi:MAG: hypothetical protein PHT57_13355 [Rhodoferax sp.]|nr:hypothetical protein [Rhodoferax sp.]